jgi:hypothetical protein
MECFDDLSPKYRKKPLISLGWFSGETSAYSRSLDHDHLYYIIDLVIVQCILPANAGVTEKELLVPGRAPKNGFSIFSIPQQGIYFEGFSEKSLKIKTFSEVSQEPDTVPERHKTDWISCISPRQCTVQTKCLSRNF